MHTMDNTKKIITIIGLAFEVLSVFGIIFSIWLLNNIESLPGMSMELANMSQEEYEFMMWIFEISVNIMSVMIFIVGLFAIINVYLWLQRTQRTKRYEKRNLNKEVTQWKLLKDLLNCYLFLFLSY